MNDKQQAALLVTTQFVLLGILAWAGLALPAPPAPLWLRFMGAAVAGIGLMVVGVAILTHLAINRSLVNITPEPNPQRKLVSSGIYTYVRHPIYTGVILAAAGTAITHGHWVSLLIAVLLGLFFTYKSMFEEKWLRRVYPEYAAYQQRSGRFFPPLLRR
ncbi:MAG: isoprenylcysteine carboxylmethyltransferase family protein [Anaerolineae bacterium]|nr:isoprenylcysteine carboxylmethyltransferase family protein [Anaerolineae bacterium]